MWIVGWHVAGILKLLKFSFLGSWRMIFTDAVCGVTIAALILTLYRLSWSFEAIHLGDLMSFYLFFPRWVYGLRRTNFVNKHKVLCDVMLQGGVWLLLMVWLWTFGLTESWWLRVTDENTAMKWLSSPKAKCILWLTLVCTVVLESFVFLHEVWSVLE